MQADAQTFFRILAEEAAQEFDPLELVYPREVPVFEKYDEYVPAELVRKGFALGVFRHRRYETKGTQLVQTEITVYFLTTNHTA